jgi:hypothetical protein
MFEWSAKRMWLSSEVAERIWGIIMEQEKEWAK